MLRIKCIFYDAIKDGSLNNLYFYFADLSDKDLADALEQFTLILTNIEYLGELNCEVLLSKYSACELEHPVFVDLMSMSFFMDRDMES